eukprot:TRINITY_DN29852_c0_g1_i2.p1 TRINITY_DN29852_c0_g1~~TRINITY_DN29852_c0_g1_i2.p1  ORF type:complete len:1224 (-),score=282.85 TRINITY_DN29852_c0_g1_i2:196-3792(-)
MADGVVDATPGGPQAEGEDRAEEQAPQKRRRTTTSRKAQAAAAVSSGESGSGSGRRRRPRRCNGSPASAPAKESVSTPASSAAVGVTGKTPSAAPAAQDVKARRRIEKPPKTAEDVKPFVPHLVTTARPVEYHIAIPTYQRWRPVRELVRKRCHRECEEPFILVYTLRLLSRHGIASDRVTLFVASEDEAARYKEALLGSDWAAIGVVVSRPGIRDSRNFIMQYYPAGSYVVSLDDDLQDIIWKYREDVTAQQCIQSLPHGQLETLIYDGHHRMKERRAFLWGVNTSQNPMCMNPCAVTERNGLVNGYMHGFITRPHCRELLRTLTDAVEDCEFSVRHYAKDGVHLRYRMYAAITNPYANGGGLQTLFKNERATGPSSQRAVGEDGACPVKAEPAALSGGGQSPSPSTAQQDGCSKRKAEERNGAAELHRLFPKLIAPHKARDSEGTMEVVFRRVIGVRTKRKVASVASKGAAGSGLGGTPITRPRRKIVSLVSRGGHPILIALFASGKRRRSLLKTAHKEEPVAETATDKGWEVANLLHDDDGIRYRPNPKRPGSKAHELYEAYCSATTLGEARRKGVRTIDLMHDSHNGFVFFTSLSRNPRDGPVWELADDTNRLPAVAPAATAGEIYTEDEFLRVRFKELNRSHAGLTLPRAGFVALLGRCEQLEPEGCLAERLERLKTALAGVAFPALRAMLGWASTGVLRFERRHTLAVREGLELCGAAEAARRVRKLNAISSLPSWLRAAGSKAAAPSPPVVSDAAASPASVGTTEAVDEPEESSKLSKPDANPVESKDTAPAATSRKRKHTSSPKVAPTARKQKDSSQSPKARKTAGEIAPTNEDANDAVPQAESAAVEPKAGAEEASAGPVQVASQARPREEAAASEQPAKTAADEHRDRVRSAATPQQIRDTTRANIATFFNPAARTAHLKSLQQEDAGSGAAAASGGSAAGESKAAASSTASSGGYPAFLCDEDRIQYKPNPKKVGSQAHQLYEKYQVAKSVGEAKSLGARSIDFMYDANCDYLVVTGLEVRPRSSECHLVDSSCCPAVGPGCATSSSAASSSSDFVKVRVKETREKRAGLTIPRRSLLQLRERCPDLRKVMDEQWSAQLGAPFAAVPLAALRTILHWGETGTLSFESKMKEEVCKALEACGRADLSKRLAGEGAAEAGAAQVSAAAEPEDAKQKSLRFFFGGKKAVS